MRLEQIRVFLAVAEDMHVTRAARRLGMTQSAASAAIAALEQQYGARLFNRVGRGIELTDTGRRFMPEARAVLERVESAKAVLGNLADRARGRISIAASQTTATYWLPRCLTGFHKLYPDIQIEMNIGNTGQVEDAVISGAVDLGLVEGMTRHPAIIRRDVDQDRLLMVVATDFPLRDPPRGQSLDLTTIPWIIREAGSGTRAVLEDLVMSKGLSMGDLKVVLVLPSNETVREAVEAGAGATIISEHVVRHSLISGRLRQIPLELPTRSFTLIRHSERQLTAAQRALVEHILDATPYTFADADSPHDWRSEAAAI